MDTFPAPESNGENLERNSEILGISGNKFLAGGSHQCTGPKPDQHGDVRRAENLWNSLEGTRNEEFGCLDVDAFADRFLRRLWWRKAC